MRSLLMRGRGLRGSVAALLMMGLTTAAGAADPIELISNGSFELGVAPWISTGNLVLEADAGRLCADVPAGTASPFEVIAAQFGLGLVAGEQYRLAFKASGSSPQAISLLVQDEGPPFATSLFRTQGLVPAAQEASYYFVAPASSPAAFYFFVGGSSEPWRFCVDDVSLLSATSYTPDTGSRVRVNQVGYLPFGPKAATLVTEASDSVAWQLLDDSGHVVMRGRSQPRGIDPTSGLNVHQIRFDQFHNKGKAQRHGTGFTLVADGEASHPFDISDQIYRTLRADSLAVFYTQRSGTPIEGAVAGAAYARDAGHAGLPPNLGDVGVPCQPAEVSLPIYGEPWTCDYTLDVDGGWYDAGDHGKYVVNGGIAVAQLLSTYERSREAPSAERGALGDGSLRVPESNNQVPDVLDEARWELEWMLKMQVPAGKPLAGMVHHKVHDFGWTGLPLAPAADPNYRELHRPSTAATLNLAAAAGQGARLFRKYDRAFAKRLLDQARIAFDAAQANPNHFAPAADGANGGGPYDDSDVSDELYWAAAELYITTGEPQFRRAVLASPHHTGDVFDIEGMYWGSVAALGRMHLATAKTRLHGRERVVRSVLEGANAVLALAKAQAWGQPYAPVSGRWGWGSNSQILNNLMVLGTAYDLSGHAKYRDAVLEGMDYVLGRNALNISYVTGYGDVFSQNQHSRMYSAQLDGRLPHPPVGTIAGGPNSDIQDPVAQQLLAGCLAQLCYIDDIESWSTNELAINWNAALGWVASFLADQGAGDCE